MVRTHIFACRLPKAEADALNAESGQVYSTTLIWQYRIYRRKGIWLSPGASARLCDYISRSGACPAPTTLHAHSRDAAQQAFHRACKTARKNRPLGARCPRRHKFYRTTVWKNTGIRIREGKMLLARARGRPPVEVRLPAHLSTLPAAAFREVRLVWDRAARRYFWHVVVEDGSQPPPPPGERTAAVDLGEVHPAALCDSGVDSPSPTPEDGHLPVVFSARALRSVYQYTAKRLAEIQREQARKKKSSRRWKRLQRRKNRFLARQKRRARDIRHKVSRAVVDEARRRGVGTLVIGDVRDAADGRRLSPASRQKISLWSHGQLRWAITYKAEAAGMRVQLVDEAYTSQTCPQCGGRHKPTGRVFRCPACGFVSHRDIVGAANLLSRCRFGEVGHVRPPPVVKYRHPFVTGKRSRLDTAQVARGRGAVELRPYSREAAGL